MLYCNIPVIKSSQEIFCAAVGCYKELHPVRETLEQYRYNRRLEVYLKTIGSYNPCAHVEIFSVSQMLYFSMLIPMSGGK